MTQLHWHEEPIAKAHPRDAFDCGDAALNTFLRKFARQNHESGGGKTFLAVANDDGRVLGFYTLTLATAEYDDTPESLRRGLARHPIPGFRLARLATDLTVRGQGLGAQLLLAAGKRCLRVADEAGGVALYIDAKNDRVARWYETFGALRLSVSEPTLPIPLVIPLRTIANVLKTAGKL